MVLVKKLIRVGDATGVILDAAILRQVDIQPDSDVEIASGCWSVCRNRGTSVNKDKRAKLEAHGWLVGSAEDFLRQPPARKGSRPSRRRRQKARSKR